MPANMNWRDVLSPELVRQIEDEIDRQFVDGWMACKRAVAALEPGRSSGSLQAAEEVDESARPYPNQRAPRGFWASQLDKVLEERFPQELRLSDGMKALQARTHQFELARSSYNVAVQTLEREGKLRREGKKLLWVPRGHAAHGTKSQSGTAEADAGEEHSASAVYHTFGGTDDAAA